jgi:MoxR-like ATPase
MISPTEGSLSGLQSLPAKILDEVGKAIVGKREVLETILLAILANGHVLFEDYPGLAKTLTARSFAASIGADFKRIQFTSDLLPADITGSYILDRNTSSFKFRRGPIFCNILLADEINRAPPRTQSALLEAMQERQVTIENDTMKLESPFLTLATQNPIEYEGTYPLPEAQLDRFIMKIVMGYPSEVEEAEILDRRSARQSDEVLIDQVARKDQVIEMQETVEKVHIEREIEKYIVDIVTRTRKDSAIEIGSSPRGGLAILKLSKARAWVRGRDYVLPDDVKSVCVPALSHRIILTAEQWVRGTKPETIIENILERVEVPKAQR